MADGDNGICADSPSNSTTVNRCLSLSIEADNIVTDYARRTQKKRSRAASYLIEFNGRTMGGIRHQAREQLNAMSLTIQAMQQDVERTGRVSLNDLRALKDACGTLTKLLT